jgi:cell division septation protein DedD
MRIDQMTKGPGGQPATRDPLAQLAELIAQDETFAAIVRDNGRSKQRLDYPLRGDEPTLSGRAGADIPPNQDWDGDPDQGDCDEPDDSDRLPDRRSWLRMAAAIFGLALLGSASALAYWAWFDERVSMEEARPIAASTAPEKITPTSQQEAGRTVSGEEKPTDPQPAAPPALPPISLPSGGAPAQLAALPPAAAPPDSTAAVQNQPPPANEAAPNPTAVTATEPSVGNGSKYVVQLSSQRSEAAAQATSHGLQTKYAGLFGSLQPFIRRSDLRDKGVYYRVLIGPFPAFGEANQLCGSLKKSGGDCVVQRN